MAASRTEQQEVSRPYRRLDGGEGLVDGDEDGDALVGQARLVLEHLHELGLLQVPEEGAERPVEGEDRGEVGAALGLLRRRPRVGPLQRRPPRPPQLGERPVRPGAQDDGHGHHGREQRDGGGAAPHVASVGHDLAVPA